MVLSKKDISADISSYEEVKDIDVDDTNVIYCSIQGETSDDIDEVESMELEDECSY